jgi:tetratricopeptide (TPR) repeat protein
VRSILEGGVQRAGDRVRINVQLIDAASDAHLWAESYDRELTAANIFAIQSEVAAAIAGALKATLTAGEKARVNAVPTRNLEAWESYQLGRQRLAKRTSSGFTEAERYFRTAIDLDPNFALAHSGLADSLTVRLDYTDAPRAVTLERAQAAVDAALKLDSGLADAWASAGLIESWRDHRDRAEEMYRRAIDLNPNHVMARKWYGEQLMELGRVEEGFAQLEEAARLDPLSAIVRLNLGDALVTQGRFRDAASQYRKAIEIDPLMPHPYGGLADLAAHAANDFAAAVPLAEKAEALDPDNPNKAVALVALHWEMGDDAAFGLALRQAGQRWPDDLNVRVWLAGRDLQRRDWDGASRHARRVLDLHPRDETGLAMLGIVDYRQGRHAAAAERYRQVYPELFATLAPPIDASNVFMVLNVVPILQALGEHDRANLLLDGVEAVLRKKPRLGNAGYAPSDAAVLALRGRKREALEALRTDQQAGWRSIWPWYRDVDPTFDSIRDEPEFKVIFADIERDMARQRAELAKRPKDAPLDLGVGE